MILSTLRIPPPKSSIHKCTLYTLQQLQSLQSLNKQAAAPITGENSEGISASRPTLDELYTRAFSLP